MKTQPSAYTTSLDAYADTMVVDLAGTRTTPRAWAASLNLTHRPGVVLFDSGKEAARINDRQQDLLRQGINIDFSE